ncbi:hypothetical protein ES703_109427 [subsurface metagenome]
MILITVECKWRSSHLEVINEINKIEYFKTNKKSIDEILEMVLLMMKMRIVRL